MAVCYEESDVVLKDTLGIKGMVIVSWWPSTPESSILANGVV
jgi:hypothetical protein